MQIKLTTTELNTAVTTYMNTLGLTIEGKECEVSIDDDGAVIYIGETKKSETPKRTRRTKEEIEAATKTSSKEEDEVEEVASEITIEPVNPKPNESIHVSEPINIFG